MPPPSLRVDALEQQWRSLVNFGPRVHGTASGEAAATFVERELSAAGLVVQRQPFLAPGWQANGVASLELLAPERRGVAAHSMLLGAGTPGGGAVEGVIVDVGWLNLWGGQHAWRRLALVGHDGRPVAYICGRLNGSAVPQLLPSGSAP